MHGPLGGHFGFWVHSVLLRMYWLMDSHPLLLISCIGAQTTQIYDLALSRAHGWPVLVHTVVRHGPLAGHGGFRCIHLNHESRFS